MDSSDVKTRSFVGAITSAIKAICMLLIDLVSVASEGVAMADQAVKSAREKQGVELKLSMSDYASIAIKKAAKAQEEAHQELEAFIGNDPKKLERINKRVSDLTTLVNQEIASIHQSRA